MMPPLVPQKTLVVVPTLDEADNVDALLDGIERHAPGVHVLFVDDASKDGTPQKIRARQSKADGRVHLIERPGKLGLGTAYVTGFKWALARGYLAAVEMDADLSHRPEDLAKLLATLASHACVVGSRYVKGGGTRNWSPHRKLISRCGSLYARIVLRLPIRDLTGGFNGWRREVLEKVDLDGIRSEGYSFQIELKYRAHLAGFTPVEFPIIFEERREGQSKMSGGIVLEAIWRVWGLLRIEKLGK